MGILTGAGRVGRLHYFGVGLAIGLITWIGFYASVDIDEFTGEVEVSPLIIVVFLASMWFSGTNVLRRLHDCGHSGWMLLLSLVPIIGTLLWIYLLFVPGDPVRNLYGPPPGSSGPASPDAHRQRMELLTAAAEHAYRARTSAGYVNVDGSYNMDWLTTEHGDAAQTKPVASRSAAPEPPVAHADLATLPPPPVTGTDLASFPPPAVAGDAPGPPAVETVLSTLRYPAEAGEALPPQPTSAPPGGDGHGPALS
ncbi:MAG: DUF805 domain-containing protein [Acidimicrobiia bacterium]|nr:DUF805 domain-containing protein [Acidimicrobiia bacterium]